MLASLTAATATALLSPSARVLVASSAPDAGVARAASLPWSDVHWPTLVALATWERAESPIYRLLRAAPSGGVPADVMQAVQGLSRVAEFRAGELEQAATQSVDVLRAAGITPIWLKGAALAMQSPLGFGVRAMGDLDLLVEAGELGPARSALLAGGWDEGAVSRGYDGHHHVAPLVRHADLRLELHDAIFPPGHPFPDAAELSWRAHGVPWQWAGREVRVLDSAWHIAHASLHWAWSHEGSVGTWQFLHDIHRFTVTDPDWDEVVAASRELGGAPVVGMALWSASRLAGVAVPESVVLALRGRPMAWDGLAERAWALRALHSPMASPSVRWSRFWWRRAVRGIGDEGGAWPWALGRAAAAVSVPVSGSSPGGAAGIESGVRSGSRMAGWRRHLGRVLRG